MLNDATPDAFTGTFDAQVVEPSVKVTVPDGVPAAEVVVEVNVTDWPKFDGFGAELNVVVVLAVLFTTCGAPVPLLLPHPTPPVKAATMVWLPTASAVVVNDAWPEPFTVTFDAQIVDPSVKVTLPTGVPAPDVVVAVNVTAWPTVEGFGEDVTVVAVVVCTS